MAQTKNTLFLGWHGFGLEHPGDWELNVVKGNRKSSYMCLDDGEAARLEISWKPVPRRMSLEKLAEAQRKALVRTAKRRKVEIELKDKTSFGRPKGFEYRTYAWTADVGACELLARCEDCGRVILIRVLGRDRSVPTEEARGVFRSLKCYSGKDHERWGAFGLDVKVPVRFDLEASSLKAGACELTFSDKRVELRVGRVSMGRAILEKEKMVRWYERFVGKMLKPFEVTWTEKPFGDHLGYEGSGEPWSGRGLLKIFRSPRRLKVRCFYCEPSDKILAVTADGVGDLDALVNEVLAGLRCH